MLQIFLNENTQIIVIYRYLKYICFFFLSTCAFSLSILRVGAQIKKHTRETKRTRVIKILKLGYVLGKKHAHGNSTAG